MNFRQATETIVQQRKAELDAAAAVFDGALRQTPALLEVETALRALLLGEAKGKAVDLPRKTALAASKSSILKSIGLTEKILNPPPRCKKCGDTGHFKGDFCVCVKALTLNDKKNLEIPVRSFSEINYSLFDEQHRARNQAVYADVETVCEKYPLNKRRMITLLGNTGTGKTLLAGCAADKLLQRGFAVAAVTAFGFVNRALKYHTAFDGEKFSYLEPLLESDLLVIDDLGNESILKNVTMEYLYTVLNERLNAGKLTFITSNLSRDGILTRYGERIYSRLFDKSLGYTNTLGGKDLRI